MKDNNSLHLKVKELCDCYKTTDYLAEMAKLDRDGDQREAAAKWLALATLHGINANAKKISISKSTDGTINVTAKYRRTDLPSPGSAVGEGIFAAIREITHLDGPKGKTPLAMGVENESIELRVELESGKKGESITLRFPE